MSLLIQENWNQYLKGFIKSYQDIIPTLRILCENILTRNIWLCGNKRRLDTDGVKSHRIRTELDSKSLFISCHPETVFACPCRRSSLFRSWQAHGQCFETPPSPEQLCIPASPTWQLTGPHLWGCSSREACPFTKQPLKLPSQ